MERQTEFSRVRLIIIGSIAAIFATSLAGYSVLHKKQVKTEQTSDIPSFFEASPEPSLTPEPTLNRLLPTYTPAPTLSSTATINVFLTKDGNPVIDDVLVLHVRNETTQEEKTYKNTTSNWTISGVTAGKYKVTIPFIYTSYYSPQRNCQGCRDQEDKSENQVCGYVLYIQGGDNIKIYCNLRKAQQLSLPNTNPNQPIPADTSPPAVSVSNPWGPVYGVAPTDIYCFLLKGNDDVPTTDAQFSYRSKVDHNSWSDWNHNPYPCYSNLPSGAHIFSAQVMDLVGKISDEKSVNFTVNSGIN